jgi:AraC-like DNA-binding protein
MNTSEKNLTKKGKTASGGAALAKRKRPAGAQSSEIGGGYVSIACLTAGARLLQRYAPYEIARAARETRMILERAGFASTALEQRDGRLPLQVLMQLLEMGARVTGDAAFGLHCGMYSERGDLELLEYLLSSCNTLGDTLDVANRYQALVNDVVRHDVIEERGQIVWHIRLPDGLLHLEAFLAAWMMQLVRRCSGLHVNPTQVRFAHARGSYADECARYFQTTILYGAACTSLVMPVGALNLPFITADPVLHRLLRRQADAALAALPTRDSLQRRVRALVAAELSHGTVNLERIAKRAHMTVSTLRRRLSDEGVRFGMLTEEVRQATAQRCLSDPRLTMKDVAERAGFATVPAFHRAFIRWFGETPARYRKAREYHPAASWLGSPSDD